MARSRTARTLNDHELARILYREVERTSIRDVAALIGIGRTTLDNLLYTAKELPELDTIEKIAAYLQRPAYEVLRLAGFDTQLPPDMEQGAALIQLANQRPELRRVLRQLPALTPDQTKGLLAYLQALAAMESADG